MLKFSKLAKSLLRRIRIYLGILLCISCIAAIKNPVHAANPEGNPIISNIRVTKAKKYYTITVDVSAPYGIQSVSFASWTGRNGKDDLVRQQGSRTGNTITCKIKTSDHGDMNGIYYTKISVTDKKGNRISSKKRISMTEGAVKITQYPSTTGLMSGIYTITTKDGHLIVVDGGWEEDEELLRSIVKSKGNTVDAWIITHPHYDHVGAFVRIMKDPNGMHVRRVYASPYNHSEYVKRNGGNQKAVKMFRRYEAIMKACKVKTFLRESDSLNLYGLQIDVMNSFSKSVTSEISPDDVYNNGSLLFKMSSGKKSMIFCGDVGSKMAGRLIRNHRRNLNCDYIQASHHGNLGLTEKFYKLTTPKAVFFDAPDWLMTGESYTTSKTISWFRAMGSKIYSYHSGPNAIYLS